MFYPSLSDANYQLEALVVHYGESGFGHYFTLRKVDGVWYEVGYDFKSHLLLAMVIRRIRKDSLLQVGLSDLNCEVSSSKPLATSLALRVEVPSLIFSVQTHLVESRGWPISSTSV